jgi:hypothetical protein
MLRRRNSEPFQGLSTTVSKSSSHHSRSDRRGYSRGVPSGECIIVRSQSLPILRGSTSYGSLVKIKGILKYSSVPDTILRLDDCDQELLHYDSDDSRPAHVATRIAFSDIMIREYARTIGDNPSCSSGPPIS